MSNANDMAFPVPPEHAPNNSLQFGLTKREYIAAMAMPGLMGRVWNEHGQMTGEQVIEQWAKSAVVCADALLAELAK